MTDLEMPKWKRIYFFNWGAELGFRVLLAGSLSMKQNQQDQQEKKYPNPLNGDLKQYEKVINHLRSKLKNNFKTETILKQGLKYFEYIKK